jgi:hypothetical protein
MLIVSLSCELNTPKLFFFAAKPNDFGKRTAHPSFFKFCHAKKRNRRFLYLLDESSDKFLKKFSKMEYFHFLFLKAGMQKIILSTHSLHSRRIFFFVGPNMTSRILKILRIKFFNFFLQQPNFSAVQAGKFCLTSEGNSEGTGCKVICD